MQTANGDSPTCGAPAFHNRRPARMVCAAALLCLTLGPATGIVHAVHLAHAGHDHDANNCPVCQQLISTSKCVLDPPAEVSVVSDPCWLAADGLVAEFPPQFVPLRILPRGPPSTFVL